MGFFGRKDAKADPWRDGVTAPATIERVHATGRQGVPPGPHTGPDFDLTVRQLFMVFRFTDQGGDERVVERELWIRGIREPGSPTTVAYLPGDIEGSLDYDHADVRGSDPATPRGWGAGCFEIEPLGVQCTMADPVLVAERHRFQAGPRAEATVVRHKIHVLGGDQGNLRCTLELLVNGAEHAVDVRTFPGWLPNPGDRIQVAVGADGSPIALDTDERYYGPPGRFLVYSTLTLDPAQAMSILPEGSALGHSESGIIAELDQQLAQMKAVRFQMGKRYEKTIRMILDGYLRSGQIDQATYDELIRSALS